MPGLRKVTDVDALRKVTGGDLANVDDFLYVHPLFMRPQKGTTMADRRFASLSLCAPQKVPIPLSRTQVRTFDEICRFMRLVKRRRFPGSWNKISPLSPTRRRAEAFCAGRKMHLFSWNSSSRSLDSIGLGNYPCKKYALW
jgi:hypothetical protein